MVEGFPDGLDFSLFFHDFSDTLTEFELVRKASAVYCGNEKIYATLKPHAPRIEELWSPATIRPSGADVGVGEITIFSFGMAHKLRAHHYFRLRQLLEQSGRSYTIFLSTALHEGTSFEDAFTVSFEQLERVFGQHVRFLGFLSDDAVIEYLRRSTFFTAFFEQGVRANNSSVIAAMENGCVVVTNLDEHSPDFCRHGETVFDIGRLDALPTDAKLLSAVSEAATAAVRNRSWDALLERLV